MTDIHILNKKYEELVRFRDSRDLPDIIKNILLKAQSYWEIYFNTPAFRRQISKYDKEIIEADFQSLVDYFSTFNDKNNNTGQGELPSINYSTRLIIGIEKSFVRNYQNWRSSNRLQKDREDLEILKKEAEQAASELSRLKYESAKLAEAIKGAAEDTKDVKLAKYYYQLYEGEELLPSKHKTVRIYKRFKKYLIGGYRGKARFWILITAISLILISFYTYYFISPSIDQLLRFQSGEQSATSLIAILIAKALVLAPPFYLIRFCVKNYNSNKHLAIDAHHKAKMLQTLPVLLGNIGDDKESKKEVIVMASRLFFESPTSGYISDKDELQFPSINLSPFQK